MKKMKITIVGKLGDLISQIQFESYFKNIKIFAVETKLKPMLTYLF